MRRGGRNRATAAGIRYEFRRTLRAKQVHEWDRDALKGHTYTYTDKGPFKAWLYRIGRIDSPRCPCGVEIQNAAHIRSCVLVSGGEMIWNFTEQCLNFVGKGGGSGGRGLSMYGDRIAAGGGG